ncbi:MAG: 4Fe-4S binding protein [Gracilibacteraceae bacterium]|jgi:Fe-S-cluster-containing hydrogenase component 2|nr:4Fe-4S binding protein [Gracilibacteraceae bacterium]
MTAAAGRVTVNPDKCPQDHKCPAIAVCPQEAITQKDIFALPEIDGEKCVMCGECIDFCPKEALEQK